MRNQPWMVIGAAAVAACLTPGGWADGQGGDAEGTGEDRVVVVRRTGPGNEHTETTAEPRDAGSAEAVKGDSTEAEPLIPGWTRYRHPVSGVSFQHPEAWAVRLEAAGLVITPEGHDPNRELIFGYGAPMPGVTDATALAVAQPLDGFVQSQTPGLRRQAPPTPIEHPSGSAAKYTYAGVLPDGRRAVSDVYVLVAEGTAVTISILADEQKRDERTPTLAQMFATLTKQAPPAANAPGEGGGAADIGDRRLIGMFRGEQIAAGVKDVYINTQIVYAFGADGVILNGARSFMNAQQRDHNQGLVWTADGDTEGSVQRGRWNAHDGFLTVHWDGGGRSVFAYGLEPDGSLVLRDPTTRKLINFFPRVQ